MSCLRGGLAIGWPKYDSFDKFQSPPFLASGAYPHLCLCPCGLYMNVFGELVQDLALVGWTATLVGFSCVLSAPQDRFPGVVFFCHFVFELVSSPIRFLSSFFLHTTTDLFLPALHLPRTCANTSISSHAGDSLDHVIADGISISHLLQYHIHKPRATSHIYASHTRPHAAGLSAFTLTSLTTDTCHPHVSNSLRE